MVEQLCYTRSALGLSGSAGFQVRAASDGVADVNGVRFAAFDKYLRYTLPAGSDRSLATTETSPFCLAYVDAGTERIVVHKVYTGRDAQGRPGVYFAHLLAELPHGFSARDAIDMWKSSFWLRSDSSLDPRSVKLPLVSPHQLERGSRDSYDLTILTRYLPFVIQAFLALKNDQQLYIAAPDTQTATLIWGLAHALPLPMLRSLTFSTYEHGLNDATIRIVGTCLPYAQSANSPSRQNLPVNFYNGQDLFLNCYTGDCSQIELQLSPQLQNELNEYIQFAIECLVSGEQGTPLHSMIDLADESGIDKIEPLLSLYKDFREQELSPEDMTNVLRQFKLAALRLKFGHIQQRLINLTITDQLWWQTAGKEAITNLYQHYRLHPDKVAKESFYAFNAKIINETCIAMLDPQRTPWHALVQLLDAIAPASVDPSPWVQLLNVLSQKTVGDLHWKPSRVYRWSDRKWFLQQWAYGLRDIPIEQIKLWLQDIAWGGDLEELLSGDFPHTWKLQAIVPLIASPSTPVPPFAVEIVTSHAHEFNLVLKYLVKEPSMQQQALSFFTKMVEYDYPNKGDMLAVLLLAKTSHPLDTDEVLRKAALSPEETLLFFRSYGKDLLTHNDTTGRKSKSILEIVAFYIQSFALSEFKQPESKDLLELIGQRLFEDLDRETQEHLKGWYIVGRVVAYKHQAGDFSPVDKQFFHEVGLAMRILQLDTQKEFPEFKDQLFDRLVNTRWNTQEELHVALANLSPAVIKLSEKDARKANYGNIALLYRLAEFMGRYLPSADILLPYIMLSLTYGADLEGSEKDEIVRALLVETLLRKIDRETFDAIEKEAQGWPDPIRKGWQRYGASLGPQTVGERVSSAVVMVNRVSNIMKGIVQKPSDPSQPKVSSPRKSAELPKSPISSFDKELEPSNTPSNSVLQPVSQEWIKKVAEVKKWYINYHEMRNSKQSQKAGENPHRSIAENNQMEYFLDEDNRITVLKGLINYKEDWEKEVWEDLWIDRLIDLYLSSPKMASPQWVPWLQMISQEIEFQHKRTYEDLKRDHKKVYRDLQKKNRIVDGEITIILRIFVRRNVLALNLYSQNPPLKLEDELHPYTKMYPLHLIQQR